MRFFSCCEQIPVLNLLWQAQILVLSPCSDTCKSSILISFVWPKCASPAMLLLVNVSVTLSFWRVQSISLYTHELMQPHNILAGTATIPILQRRKLSLKSHRMFVAEMLSPNPAFVLYLRCPSFIHAPICMGPDSARHLNMCLISWLQWDYLQAYSALLEMGYGPSV